MSCVEQLTGFQYHFDDVLVKVPARSLAGFPMEDEDIHSGVAALPLTHPSRRISIFIVERVVAAFLFYSRLAQ